MIPANRTEGNPRGLPWSGCPSVHKCKFSRLTKRSVQEFRADKGSVRVETPFWQSGRLEVICGPMFSGKSEELMRRLRRAQIARRRVQVFKPALDTRYSPLEIVSHSDVRMPSLSVSSAAEILEQLDWQSDVVGIDEVNMIADGLVEVVEKLANSGKQVILAGLDTDFLGRPFAPIPELLALAEYITKTLAVCVCCGAPAKHTQRLAHQDDLFVVGATGLYEARCRNCFETGFPVPESLNFKPASGIGGPENHQ